jgi:hypothetical protein
MLLTDVCQTITRDISDRDVDVHVASGKLKLNLAVSPRRLTTGHPPTAMDFEAANEAFVSWFVNRKHAVVNPKIGLEDLRESNAGRGVGEHLPS